MKHIERINENEFRAAMKQMMVKDPEGFWEIKAVYPTDKDLCYKTKDNKCFFVLETANGNFDCFALEKDIKNIKGLYEALYQMVCEGYPFIRMGGTEGRYGKILKSFGHYSKVDSLWDEYFIVYVAHPENIEKLKRRFN